MLPGAKRRFLIVNLRGSRKIEILQPDLEQIYTEFNLPFPSINKAVLSKEFRKAVNEYGITLTNVDDDDLGIQTYIPPHEIKSMVFVIGDYHDRKTYILERLRNGSYANL